MDLPDILRHLCQRRPVFHSEADFQHELAWEIKTLNPNLALRMERPIVGSGGRGALDILVMDGVHRIAIELKYVKAPMELELNGETFFLSQHAYDFAAYDCCKDLERLEHLVGTGQVDEGHLVVLTNHPGFWQATRTGPSLLDTFAMREGRTLTGSLAWPAHAGIGTTRKRERPIVLAESYGVTWSDYSQVGSSRGTFRFVVLNVIAGPQELANETAERPSPVASPSRSRVASKYAPLADHLKGVDGSITMTFAEIEQLVGPLPPSARAHPAWWSHQPSHSHVVWASLGYRASPMLADEIVTFRRIND